MARFGPYYYKHNPDAAPYQWEIHKVFDGRDSVINHEMTETLAELDCQRKYIMDLERDRLDAQTARDKALRRVDDLEHDYGVLLFNGTQMDNQAFEALRAPEHSSEIGNMLRDARIEHSDQAHELERLEARDKRFIKQVDALNKLLGELLNREDGVLASVFLQAMEDSGGRLEMSPMMTPGIDWYHSTPEQVLEMLSKAEISEGYAAYLLDVGRIEVRVKMEQAYGANWRDIADEAEAKDDKP